jgi:fructosamine-3-kinase
MLQYFTTMRTTIGQVIETTIGEATGQAFEIASESAIGGGCIHDAACVSGVDGRQFFVKRNHESLLYSFEAEAFALRAMAKTATIRVPQPVGTGSGAGHAVLVLEFLPMGGGRSGDWHAMGKQLARLHRTQSDAHGWPHDNWIGSTPQPNTRNTDWIAFYIECRLRPQVGWARKKGLRLARAGELESALPGLFAGYHPVPSLLHGDLWAGNADFMVDGTPVVFDPAAYYGDREADLAMTEMFGGFPAQFYQGYNDEWPLDPGYRVRKQLYLLYHTLNHYNLFGGGYGSQAEAIIRRLLNR